MSEIITVDQLIQEVREQTDEMNERGAKTDDAILRVLNRGQKVVNSVLARHYPDPLLQTATLDLSQGPTVPIPTDCFDDRAEVISVDTPAGLWETERRSFRDEARLSTPGTVAVPLEWDIEGRNIRFFQRPSGTYNAQLKYIRRLDKLIKSQGQISRVGSDYVIVDQPGGDLSENSDSRASYVNIINFQTGEVKFTCQVASITNGKIRLRSTPDRSTVLGRSVSGSADLADAEVTADDFVCLSEGSCVPYFSDSIRGYLVQYAVGEISRSQADGDARLEQQLVKDIEERVAATWSGRTPTARVNNRSSIWPRFFRRYPTQA